MLQLTNVNNCRRIIYARISHPQMIAMPLVLTRWLMAFQNVTVLAAYPRGIGLGDAWLKYMAPVAYPQVLRAARTPWRSPSRRAARGCSVAEFVERDPMSGERIWD